MRWLLAPDRGVPAVAAARWNVEALRVVGRCPCGCASVDFARPGEGSGMTGYRDWLWNEPDGSLCSAFLFDHGGGPGGLEVYALDGPGVPTALPRPDELRDRDEPLPDPA